MGRLMMRRPFSVSAAIAVLLGSLLLSSCEDIASLMAKVDDDVLIANNRYLIVQNTFPEDKDPNMSPKITLEVNLDRAVSPEAIKDFLVVEMRDGNSTPVVFGSDTRSWEDLDVSFQEGSRDLIVTPVPFWAGGQKITVLIKKGAPALDGSKLREDVSWSFSTVKYPVGVLDFQEPSGAEDGYSRTTSNIPLITYSNADRYKIADTLAAAEAVKWDDPGWLDTDSVSAEDEAKAAFDLTGHSNWAGDGLYEVYILFKDNATNTVSDPAKTEITLDRVLPTISGATNASRTKDTVNRSITITEDDSGVQSIDWDTGGTGTLSGDGTESVSITGPANTYIAAWSIDVTVVDRSGNSTTETFDIEWDTVPWGPPGVSRVSGETTGDPQLQWSLSPGTQYNSDVNSGYATRLGSVSSGTKPITTWSSWGSVSTSTSRSYTIDVEKLGLPVGFHTFNLQARQYDAVGNISSGSSTSSTDVTLEVVRPINDSTVAPYYSRGYNINLDWYGTVPIYSTYHVFGVVKGDEIIIADDLPLSAYTLNSPLKPSSGTYYWRYKIWTDNPKIFGDEKYSYESPIFQYSVK